MEMMKTVEVKIIAPADDMVEVLENMHRHWLSRHRAYGSSMQSGYVEASDPEPSPRLPQMSQLERDARDRLQRAVAELDRKYFGRDGLRGTRAITGDTYVRVTSGGVLKEFCPDNDPPKLEVHATPEGAVVGWEAHMNDCVLAGAVEGMGVLYWRRRPELLQLSGGYTVTSRVVFVPGAGGAPVKPGGHEFGSGSAMGS